MKLGFTFEQVESSIISCTKHEIKNKAMIHQPTGLSNLQVELLKLYANNISDQSLLEIKSLLANYFAQKATEAMDKVWEEKGLSAQDMINWTNEHNRRK